MNTGGLIFQGSGPFHLPLAQRARAHGNKHNGVDITFYILVDASDPAPKAVSIQATPDVALDLAEQLVKAASSSGPE